MSICPCCKRKLTTPRDTAIRADLTKDLARAQHAINSLESALRWPHESESFKRAVHEELQRMERAQTDHGLLWRIYQRNSKKPSYAAVDRLQIAA